MLGRICQIGLWSLGLVGLFLYGCQADETPPTVAPTLEPVTLKLNWQHGAGFLGFYVAQSRGFYAQEGLDVTIKPKVQDEQAILDQVASGAYDFSVGGAVYRAQAEDDTPVTAIAAMYQFGPDAFFTRADTGIVTPADLAGRSVVVKSPGWERQLMALLARVGLTLDDVEVVPGGFDMTPFFEGHVEVWAGFINDEVVRARQRGVDVVTLPLYEYGLTTVAQTLAVGQTTLAENPDLTERFLRASLRGWEWAVEHPTEAVDLMLDMFPDMAAERDFHLASFDASIPLIRPPGVRVGSLDCAAWLAHEAFEGVSATERFCTEDVLQAVWESDQE